MRFTRDEQITILDAELANGGRGYATAIEISPAGGDGSIEWNASVIEVIKLDSEAIAYRYSDDSIDEDWQLGTIEDAVDAAIEAYKESEEVND